MSSTLMQHPQQVVIVCAWCQHFIEHGHRTDKTVEDHMIHATAISHTICRPCCEQYFPGPQ